MGTIKPWDLGPSFLFELSKNDNNDIILEAYKNSFAKYIINTKEEEETDIIRVKRLIDSKNSEINIRLDQGTFSFMKFKDIQVLIQFIGHEMEESPFCATFFGQLKNEAKYEYLCIYIFKNRPGRRMLETPDERNTFHEILKIWIKALQPVFIWGDNFSLIKKYENEDSRFRVWGYNYYSESLTNAIGIKKFRELVNENNDWTVQEIDHGTLLIGLPDPYATSQKSKLKAKKILELDRSLQSIVVRKK